jgi:uncharacterized protein with HEPN domain
MVKRSVRLRLHDILEAIEGIRETVAGIDFETYRNTWHIRRAVERGVEIISEARPHIPDKLKREYPHIYWQEIAAIGNLLRHEYQRVDDRIMWRVVERYLPELEAAIRDMARRAVGPGG